MKRIFVACALCLFAGGLMAGEALWEGFYGGLHVGMAQDGNPGWTYTNGGSQASLDELEDDCYAGLQLGYGWQCDQWVFGIEGDLSFADISEDGVCPNPSWDCHVELNETASLRGRLGYAMGRCLPYVTAGFAMTRAEISDHRTGTGTFGEKSNMYGPVYGAGVAYAVTDNLSVFVEYLRYDFNKESMVVDNDLEVVVDTTPSAFRAGINYLFR